MKITIYSTTTCPYCGQIKDYLNAKGIPFDEKLVDQSEELREEMRTVTGGFMGVPYILIEKENGQKEGIIGFDKGKIESVLSS